MLIAENGISRKVAKLLGEEWKTLEEETKKKYTGLLALAEIAREL